MFMFMSAIVTGRFTWRVFHVIPCLHCDICCYIIVSVYYIARYTTLCMTYCVGFSKGCISMLWYYIYVMYFTIMCYVTLYIKCHTGVFKAYKVIM